MSNVAVSCDLQVKRRKLSTNYEEERKSPGDIPENIHHADIDDVASYEEVTSTSEEMLGCTSPIFSGYCDIKNLPDIVPTTNIYKEEIHNELPIEEISALNIELFSIDGAPSNILSNLKVNKEIYEIYQNLCESFPFPKENKITETEKSLYHQWELSKEHKMTELEKLVYHQWEIKAANERSYAIIQTMVSLAAKCEPNDEQIHKSNKVSYDNESKLSKVNHSSEARATPNMIKHQKKAEMVPSDSTSISKTHPINYRSCNAVCRQESIASKEERKKAMFDRRIVFVGNIPHGYSDLDLRERFQKFGTILDIQIKSKVRSTSNSCFSNSLDYEKTRFFGFITFSSFEEAKNAIEKGNKGHDLKFLLNFGARRQFVGEEYKDLDGIVAENEFSLMRRNSRSSFQRQNEDVDYSELLNGYSKSRGNFRLF